MEEIQTETPIVSSNMTGQELLEAVRNQVEYYFSKENLQSDAFLTSQMDAQMSVPISVVMKFAKMKALTQDEAVIRQALEHSTITQVVDNRIKANIKPAGRSTIILREIPSDTSVDEVKEIFNYEGCKVVSSIRSDIGDSWFVHMDCEEDAKDTLLDLRMKKRTFRGQSVKARLKTETVIRSFYPLQSAPVVPVGYPAMGFPGPMDMRAFGYALPEGVMPPISMIGTEVDVASPGAEGGKAADSEHGHNSGSKSSSGNNTSKDGRSKQQHSRGSNAVSSGNNSSSSSTGKRGDNSGSASRPSKASNNASNSSAHGKAPVIEINSANFPPLQNNEDTPVPTPGYKGAYQKYSFEDIISIVKEVKEATLPPALNPVNHPLALTATPNLDLLKKQRTYSIDETREQLRQGRPVHREAVTAGAVDYRSMMYGDEGQQQQSVITTAVPAVTTSAQPAVTTPAPAAKVATKARSNSQSSVGEHQQTPKKISASSWAAMVKSSAAATAAVDSSATPAKPVRTVPSAVKAPPSADAKKAAPVANATAKNGDRKRSSSKGGENKEKSAAAAAGSAVAGEGRRDRKKGNKEGQSNKKEEEGASTAVAATDAPTSAGEASNVTSSEQTVAAASGAPWGGKTSFAQIVKLKTPEDAADSPASASSPPAVKAGGVEAGAATAVPKKSSGGSGAGRQQQTASKSGSNGNKTGSAGSSRSAGGKEGGADRRVRSTAPTQSGVEGTSSANNRRPAVDRAAAPSASSTAAGGASASGVWVREALPALSKK